MPIPRPLIIGSALALSTLAPLQAVDVLFVGNAATPTSGADAAVMTFLESRYGAANVDYLRSSEASTGDELAYDLLVISSTVSSGSVRGKFHNSPVGILNWEEALADNSAAGEFALTQTATKEFETTHTLRINASHPITAGFSVGQLVQVASGNTEFWWSTGTQASGSTSLAADDDNANNRYLTTIDAGDTLLTGSAAPGRRIMLGMTDASFNNLTAAGLQLFGQATDWAASSSLPPEAPTLTNTPASNVLPTSATVGGAVTDTGNETPAVTLYWGDNDGLTNPDTWDNATALGAQSSGFSTALNSLSPSTTYFFRCAATNSAGTGWAPSTSSFTTTAPPDPAGLVNLAAADVGHTAATLRGQVTDTGGDPPSVTLFYGDNDGGTNPGNWDDLVQLGTRSGIFSSEVFALADNTPHFYRARATNAGGTSWAPSTATFDTLAYSAPAMTLDPVTSVTATGATVSGEVTNTGGDAPVVTLFYGGEDGGTNPGNWGRSVDLGAQAGNFSGTLTNLQSLTTYHVAARATNAAATVWTPSRSFATPEVSTVVINEFMASNDTTAVPGAPPGRFDDWIELANLSATPVDISGWHLTDDPGNPTKWTFPAGTAIAGNAFLVVFASGDNTPDGNGNFHTGFKLSAGGEPLQLVRPSLSVASSFGPGGSDYPEQQTDVSYGLNPADLSPAFFAVPTPGAPNDPAGFLPVADTTFDPDRGFYDTAIDVTVATDTPGATIYVTTDGSPPIDGAGNPTATAFAYAGPLPVSKTTVVRAAATKSGLAPTNIDTQTYFLMDTAPADPNGLNDVLTQTRPAGYGNLSSGDYNMDTAVSQSATYRARLLEGLQDIPSMAISMKKEDWAGGSGIYSNSTSRGFAWERACSAEFIPPPGSGDEDWQIDCGIRVQGGASRNPGSSPKHSLSLRFRETYGAGKLRRKVFPDLDIEEFNVLALRSGYNNSWIHRDGGQRSRASMIRDQFARDSMVDMGQRHGGHGIYVHLYINGLYWGVHNLCERQDAAHYATHNGADEDRVDARNGSEFTDGTSAAWSRMQSVVSSRNWEAIQQAVDIDNYIDYQIINRYGANQDLKSNGNWRAAGGGPDDLPWQLYCWDTERTLESPGASNEPLDPMGIRSTLNGIDEYRLRFADRVQKHFFNDGALTPARTAERWMERATEIDLAIIAESARWGDHRQSPAYTRDGAWITEQNRLINSYFPGRSATVLNFFRSSGLYPSLDAPAFATHGGVLGGGDTVTISVPAGSTVYYTLDGSDPRLPSTGGGTQTVLLDEGANARALVPTSDIGTSWRNPGFNDTAWQAGTTGVGYDYPGLIGLDIGQMEDSNATAYIRVPFSVPDQATLDDISSLTLNMKYDDGFVAFLNGHATSVAAANNPATLTHTSGATGSHSDSLAVDFVPFDITAHIGKLQVGTNILAIHALNRGTGSSDLLMTPQITYSDAPAAGGGISPSAIQYAGPITLPSSANIRVRARSGSTWSAINEAIFYTEELARTDDLRITELNYHPPGDAPHEFVEITNVAPYPVNLDGCALTDGVTFTFGDVRLEPSARLVLAESLTDFQNRYGNPAHAAFTGSLDNGGETVTLAVANGEVAHSVSYNDGGNWPGRADGNGSSLELADTAAPDPSDQSAWRSSSEYGGSPGTAGSGPDRRVVINEVLAHTDLPQVDTIELLNTTASSIDISGWYLTDNNAVYKSYKIPPGTQLLPPGGRITVNEAGFNPPPDANVTSYSGTAAAPPLTVHSPAHGLATGDVITIDNYGGADAYNDTFEVTVTGNDTFTLPTPFLDNHPAKGTWTRGRPFALSSSRGDRLWLVEGDASGDLVSFVDDAEFPASLNGTTLGRYPDGVDNGPLFPLAENSLGGPNLATRFGQVIITEIMYNPPQMPDDNYEYVELANFGTTTINLANWRMRGGVDFDFDATYSLAPGGVVVMVGFDPNNVALANAFRANYGIDSTVQLVGPWTDGNLDNGGDTVRVQRPDSPPAEDPTFYPQLTEDEARYDDVDPWPTQADGLGSSLDRSGTTLFGRLAASWITGPPTPGTADVPVSGTTYSDWATTNFGAGNPAGSLPGDDPDGDSIPNLAEFAGGTDPNTPNPAPPLTTTFQGDDLYIDYTRATGLAGITVTAQVSSNLVDWSPLTTTHLSSDGSTETRRATITITPGSSLYVRLLVSE